MNQMQNYLLQEKIKRIHKFKEDLKTDFNLEVPLGTGFTRSEMFHFGLTEGKKYVHKESLRFILTNGYTYLLHQKFPTELQINPNQDEIATINKDVDRMFNFFRREINHHRLFPKLIEESESFFVFEYYEDEWENISTLSIEDARYIKKHFIRSLDNEKKVITPFYNQMAKKLVKHRITGEIIMVDLKSLELRDQGSLSVFMYNDIMNNLYLLERRFTTRAKILEPFSIDYPTRATNIIKLYDWF